mgnify:CR=1 FL=1
MKSIKPGRRRSRYNAVGAVIGIVFGIIWTIAALSMGAPFFFPLFGLVFIGMGVYNAVYNYRKEGKMVQYFTFLGLGSKPEGYKEVIYTFQDDPDHATISEFIQLPIIKKFADQLSEVIVFCTDESYEKYHEALTKKTENLAGLSFIKIKHTIDFDAFVKELLSHMRENEEVILDITHSFRNIPMKLLFALKYIEMTKKVKIKK